jgi:UDP-N-acetyl-D-glucosamine dehydrogenase
MFGSASARDIFGLPDVVFPLSTAAVTINNRMPEATVALLEETFAEGLAGKHVLILGASYREDVGDTRHSPSLTLARMLADKQATVAIADPLADAQIDMPLHRDLPDAHGFDAVILAVGHKQYRAINLAAWSGAERPVVLDANGVLTRQQLASLRQAGFKVAAVGRGLPR